MGVVWVDFSALFKTIFCGKHLWTDGGRVVDCCKKVHWRVFSLPGDMSSYHTELELCFEEQTVQQVHHVAIFAAPGIGNCHYSFIISQALDMMDVQYLPQTAAASTGAPAVQCLSFTTVALSEVSKCGRSDKEHQMQLRSLVCVFRTLIATRLHFRNV